MLRFPEHELPQKIIDARLIISTLGFKPSRYNRIDLQDE